MSNVRDAALLLDAESTVMQRCWPYITSLHPKSHIKAGECTSVTRESRKRSVQFPSNKRWNRESNPSPLSLPTYYRLPG